MENSTADLDREELRQFALVTGVTLAVLFGFALPWLFDLEYRIWPWILGGMLVVWGLVAPASLKLVYRTWMRFAFLLSKVTTPLVMGTIFFLVITLVALLMRVASRDSLARRFDKAAKSYRIPSRKPPRENMEKPF